MKTLIEFAAQHGLKVGEVTYKAQGIRLRRKGYDLKDMNDFILVSFEPWNNGGWYLRNVHIGYSGPRYIDRVTAKFLNTHINVKAKSFFKCTA